MSDTQGATQECPATSFGAHEKRLMRLRAAMARHRLAGYLVPHSDDYQNEILSPSSERMAFISGFTGSAGIALITDTSAVLFTDGRYTSQALRQSDSKHWQHRRTLFTAGVLLLDPLFEWVRINLPPGAYIGFDPRVHTQSDFIQLRDNLENCGVGLKAIESNLVDEIWDDRPAAPGGRVWMHPVEFAGEPSDSKRSRAAQVLRQDGVRALLISALDNLAWLFNIRGSDLSATPYVFGEALLLDDGSASLFLQDGKLSADVKARLLADPSVHVYPPRALANIIGELGAVRIRLDVGSASVYLHDVVIKSGARVDLGVDPITLLKACKCEVELAGMRRAHQRDGLALVRFMAWFSRTVLDRENECSAAQQLSRFRCESPMYRGPSFDTISAAGPNSAEVHHELDCANPRAFLPNEIYLVDSGGQYPDGTTDVTRVLVTGEPDAQMKRRYTEVLKGHIALSRARFPVGTTGAQLDSLARQFLWNSGVDYDHGTGHGVGCYLSVHEGPQSISKKSGVALQPGMVVSIEPGYYKSGSFGIRIENLVYVRSFDPQPPEAELQTLQFETLTLAPYERRLIDVSLLTDKECGWIDAYHQRVRDVLQPLLDSVAAEWLFEETAPLQRRMKNIGRILEGGRAIEMRRNKRHLADESTSITRES